MEQIHPNRIVGLTIDVQHDFLPGGSLAVPGGDEIIDPINRMNAAIRAQGGTIVFTGDQHPIDTPHFDTWPVHCVAGTEGAALDERLDVQPQDVIINKGTGYSDGYSGFEGQANDGTTIEELIRPKADETVYVTLAGVATEYCNLNTGLDALKINPGKGRIQLLLAVDAMRAINAHAGDGDRAVQQLVAAGAIMTNSIEILTGRAFELATPGAHQ